MKRFSIFVVCLSVLLLSVSILAQNPQGPRQRGMRQPLAYARGTALAQDPQGPRGPRQRGGHRGGKRMQRMDTNNDGAISRDEWRGSPQIFDKIDKNNDGSLSREEFAVAGRNRGGQRLKRMDTNNDRQISRDEWKGGDEAFSRLDANNDGVITREELRARRRKGQNPQGI